MVQIPAALNDPRHVKALGIIYGLIYYGGPQGNGLWECGYQSLTLRGGVFFFRRLAITFPPSWGGALSGKHPA